MLDFVGIFMVSEHYVYKFLREIRFDVCALQETYIRAIEISRQFCHINPSLINV